LTVLQNGVTPNRAISRGFQQFELDTFDPSMYENEPSLKPTDTADMIIDLPRCSWSTLGRSLLRACREGVTSNKHDGWAIQNSWKSSGRKGNDFASPSIQVKISPLLAIPRYVLAKSCEFLGPDTMRLESTCRSLSVDIISARALIEKDRNVRMKLMEQEMGYMLKETDMIVPRDEDGSSKADVAKQIAKFAYRSSQRVRSQLITSGKQAERNAKRNSVEYCLVSSLLPFTMDPPDYNKCLNEDFNWDGLLSLYEFAEKVKSMSGLPSSEEMQTKSQQFEQRENHSTIIFFMD
jgi:hypothetical protein